MTLKKTLLVLFSVLLCVWDAWSSPTEANFDVDENVPERSSRLFDFGIFPFVKVNVAPVECQGKTDNSTGVCSNKQACTNEGGKEDGTCANGYGVCCVFEKRCGATVKRNVTYLVNNEYPESLSDIGNCQYNIDKANNNICQLRIDFISLALRGPNEKSVCEKDTFTFVGNAGSNPTVICGTNSGHHMYLDLAKGSGSARINIATTDKEFDRSWRIKVTQIACDSLNKAPPNCLQYHTEYSGMISSFNFQTTDGIHQLGGQRYSICIKTREGFCGIKYSAAPNEFSLSEDGAEGATAAIKTGDTDCVLDFITIPAMNKDGTVTLKDRFCGNGFAELTTYSRPFEVRVVTEEDEVAADLKNRGFNLRYTQIPC